MKKTVNKFKRIISLALLCALMLSLTSCGTRKLDVSDYIDVTFTGMNGSGTATLTVDRDGLNEFAEEKLHFSEKMKANTQGNVLMQEFISHITFADLLYIDFEEYYTNLSNKENVHVIVTMNPLASLRISMGQLESDLEFEFKDVRIEYRVKGLEKVK